MNLDSIIIAAVAAIPATIAALAAYRQSAKTHEAVNSRMTEMLELTRKAAGAVATLKEKEAESVRKQEAT